ncbi:hypothetical protein MMC18_008896 [Xylographa bjoerkii]|nr:hypothetical protein [Xylographa bjoerkii]
MRSLARSRIDLSLRSRELNRGTYKVPFRQDNTAVVMGVTAYRDASVRILVVQKTETKRRLPKRSHEHKHEHKQKHKSRPRKVSIDTETFADEDAVPEASERYTKSRTTGDTQERDPLWQISEPLALLERWANWVWRLLIWFLRSLDCLSTLALLRLNWLVIFGTIGTFFALGLLVSRARGPDKCEPVGPAHAQSPFLGANPLSILSSSQFHALTERPELSLGVFSSNSEDPQPGEPGYMFWKLCPKRPTDVIIRIPPTVAPVCSLMDAVEALLEEIEHNDDMRPLPYNMEIRQKVLDQVSQRLRSMPSRSMAENLEFSNNIRIYVQSSTQARNSLVRFLVRNRALCGVIAQVLTSMGDDVINLKLGDQQDPDLQRKRALIAMAHQHPISDIIHNIRLKLSELSGLKESTRAMDEALLTIASNLESYQERMTNKEIWFHRQKQYFSGWNEKTNAKLSKQRTYVNRVITDKFHLTTSLNDTAMNLEIIKSKLEDTKDGLDNYFSSNDVTSDMLANIYHNLNAVYGRVLITQNTLIEANALQQKKEYQLQREGNSTEIPYSKYKMIDGP